MFKFFVTFSFDFRFLIQQSCDAALILYVRLDHISYNLDILCLNIFIWYDQVIGSTIFKRFFWLVFCYGHWPSLRAEVGSNIGVNWRCPPWLGKGENFWISRGWKCYLRPILRFETNSWNNNWKFSKKLFLAKSGGTRPPQWIDFSQYLLT